jgi:excisionase family DNA binding protein
VVKLLYCGGKVGTKGVTGEGYAMASAVQTMLREVMDIRQASDYLGISADTLYRYASDGLIPAFKLGNRWRFKRSLLDGWMVEQSGGTDSGKVSVIGDRKKPVRRAR